MGESAGRCTFEKPKVGLLLHPRLTGHRPTKGSTRAHNSAAAVLLRLLSSFFFPPSECASRFMHVSRPFLVCAASQTRERWGVRGQFQKPSLRPPPDTFATPPFVPANSCGDRGLAGGTRRREDYDERCWLVEQLPRSLFGIGEGEPVADARRFCGARLRSDTLGLSRAAAWGVNGDRFCFAFASGWGALTSEGTLGIAVVRWRSRAPVGPSKPAVVSGRM